MSYIKVMGFQLNLDLKSNYHEEYLIDSDIYKKEMNESIDLIMSYNPDVVIYPEMAYHNYFNDYLFSLSKDKLIVFGSTYINNINTTIIYNNQKKYFISKKHPSKVEPMIRHVNYNDNKIIENKYLKDHTFIFKDLKFIVLNCMEYYMESYNISKDNDIFAFLVPCSNNNQNIFKDESRALHNHNSSIYSIIVNAISTYNDLNYGNGTSYIYGPINKSEKIQLQNYGFDSDNHISSILNLKDEFYFYIELSTKATTYLRNDNYQCNPKEILIRKR